MGELKRIQFGYMMDIEENGSNQIRISNLKSCEIKIYGLCSHVLPRIHLHRAPSDALPQRHQQESNGDIRRDYLKVHMIGSPQIERGDEYKDKGNSYCINCMRSTNMNISLMRMLLGNRI